MMKTRSLLQAGFLWLVSSLVSAATIDTMYLYSYGPSYSTAYPHFWLIGNSDHYVLSDGTSWLSGAGSGVALISNISSVQVSGNRVFYEFSAPASGIFFQRTDYDSGAHSSQGTLGITGPLIMSAELGSRTATLSGYTKILSNDQTWYGPSMFNYFSASVGDLVPFLLTYTILDPSGWTQDTFNSTFSYNMNGYVDFTSPVPVPAAAWLFGSGLVGMLGFRRRVAV